uniref:Uncharacterized protein n=1 Tax=Mus spicilegus TaxID=10103 RepID=A0A8C6IG73_MUSSI
MQHANSYRRNLQISEIYHFVVLGYPTVGSGEQYLEVDMSRSDAWLLGLNHGPHAAPQLCSMNEMFPNVKFHDDDIQHETYQSKYGYWIIGMKYSAMIIHPFPYSRRNSCFTFRRSSTYDPPTTVGTQSKECHMMVNNALGTCDRGPRRGIKAEGLLPQMDSVPWIVLGCDFMPVGRKFSFNL